MPVRGGGGGGGTKKMTVIHFCRLTHTEEIDAVDIHPENQKINERRT